MLIEETPGKVGDARRLPAFPADSFHQPPSSRSLNGEPAARMISRQSDIKLQEGSGELRSALIFAVNRFTRHVRRFDVSNRDSKEPRALPAISHRGFSYAAEEESTDSGGYK